MMCGQKSCAIGAHTPRQQRTKTSTNTKTRSGTCPTHTNTRGERRLNAVGRAAGRDDEDDLDFTIADWVEGGGDEFTTLK